eukprot:Platyproteum_vivax@DN2935_c0_g1_i1.p1
MSFGLKLFFRLNRGIISLTGSKVRSFLQGLIAQDVNLLDSQGSIAGLFLEPNGRVLCDTIIHKHKDEGVILETHSKKLRPLLKFLQRHIIRVEDVQSNDVSAQYTISHVFNESESAPKFELEDLGVHCSQDPRYGGLGKRLLIPVSAEEEVNKRLEMKPCPLGDYTMWRRINGVPEGPEEIPARTLPLRVNLDLLNFINFKKGCYIGQELTCRSYMQGVVRKRIFPCILGDLSLPASFTPASLFSRINFARETTESKTLPKELMSGIAVGEEEGKMEPVVCDTEAVGSLIGGQQCPVAFFTTFHDQALQSAAATEQAAARLHQLSRDSNFHCSGTRVVVFSAPYMHS